MAENNSESVDVDPPILQHRVTDTPGSGTVTGSRCSLGWGCAELQLKAQAVDSSSK